MFRSIFLLLLSSTIYGLNGRKSPIPCVDKNSDCTVEFCREYPFTAKDRCAKTCGQCSEDISRSGIITSGHRTTIETDRSKGSAISSLLPRRGNSPIRSGLCFDRKIDCRKDLCQDFPFTAKEECAKTCGFCSDDTTGISSPISRSSPGTTFGTLSPSRHESIRLNNRNGIRGSSGISYPAKHDGYETTHKTPSYSKLSRDKELECSDMNNDCTQQFCKNYPFTARARCAKTCGFCDEQSSDGGDTTNTGDRHLSLTDGILVKDRSPESDRRDKTLATVEDCRDEDSQCSQRSCREHPYKARTKCAKTCGFCGEKGSQGSIMDLRSPSVDSSDDGIVITLKNDGDGSSTRSTAISGRHLTFENGDGKSTQNSQHSSIGSRTDSSRRSSSSAHIQQSTDESYLGAQRRYPGRTGPCTDENKYCETADCKKYPKFSQRYCEKTCGYC